MAAADIATVAEFLVVVPDASSVGPRAQGTIDVASYPPPAGVEISVPSGLKLTGVTGARTSGANNFQVDATDAEGVAASIRDAINDPANSFYAAGWSATLDAGSTTVDVLGGRGPDGDVALSSTDASIVVTGFTGGSAWVDHVLDFARAYLNDDCWAQWLNRASIYLGAHLLTQIPGGLNSGKNATATSVGIGSISKSWAVAAPTDDRFGSTAWGKLYLTLAEKVMCAPGGIAGGGGDPLGIVGGC